MSKHFQFETFSIITKEERVQTLRHSIVPNTFALEIITPLPGYYGSEYLISRETPGNILFMTKNYSHFEDFYRLMRKMKSYLSFNFDASLATVDIHNNRLNAIRIRDIDSYENIAELQKAFIAEGVQMAKPRKITDLALIRIKKFLSLSCNEDGIYLDRETPDYFYLVIDHPVTWKMFEQVTHRIRNNFTELKFDVALGVLFRTGNLEDVIRIYGEKLDAEKLNQIRSNFVHALREFH